MQSATKQEVQREIGKKEGDHDQELIAEINRYYQDAEHLDSQPPDQRRKRWVYSVVALVVALLFLVTIAAQGLAIFFGPTFSFLRESWALRDNPVVRDNRSAVVQVLVETQPGGSGRALRGSGFNLDPQGLIVTNRHLVQNASGVRVTFAGLGAFRVAEWHLSATTDLAILLLEADRDLPVVDLAVEGAVRGTQVIVIGNPLQQARIANQGLVGGFQSRSGLEHDLVVIEALIYPGSSGSPVFNQQGQVIAVVFATLRDDDPATIRGLAIGVEEVRNFLSNAGYPGY